MPDVNTCGRTRKIREGAKRSRHIGSQATGRQPPSPTTGEGGDSTCSLTEACSGPPSREEEKGPSDEE